MVRLGALIVCLLSVTNARADSPLIYGDGPTQTESKNKRYLALPGAGDKTTIVFRVTGTTRQELWRMQGWRDNSYLSDDGEFLTVGYHGNNLIDLDYKPDVSMLSFYRRGALVRSVPLKELIRDLKSMPRSVSHYAWGHYLGYVDLHRFAVETVEQRQLIFDVTTGQLVSSTDIPKPPAQDTRPRDRRLPRGRGRP